jgi:hypothetical protein
MRRLVKWLFVPILVLVGLVLIAPQNAQAARWRRYPRAYGYAYRPYYVAPPVARGPGVRVVVPGGGVYVGVGPGVHVVAPGVGVHVGPLLRPYYWEPGYYGWR